MEDIIANFGKLHKLFDENFMEYTSYVIKERAIPDMSDGFKPVQRRILQTLYNMDDGRFQKVANVVGETMKLHPHGDASISAALVNLANKDLLIDRQGNFGNILTGDNAAAARYIECRLTPLAKETLFNKDLTEFEPLAEDECPQYQQNIASIVKPNTNILNAKETLLNDSQEELPFDLENAHCTDKQRTL